MCFNNGSLYTLLLPPPSCAGGFVCHSIHLYLYLSVGLLEKKEQAHRKHLPEVCFGPRNKRLHLEDDPDHDLDTGSGLRSRGAYFEESYLNFLLFPLQKLGLKDQS